VQRYRERFTAGRYQPSATRHGWRNCCLPHDESVQRAARIVPLPIFRRCIANFRSTNISHYSCSGRSTARRNRDGMMQPLLRAARRLEGYPGCCPASGTHRAGEKLFVDWAGAKIPIYHPDAGEIDSASLFVAVLGASSYTFVHATRNQDLRSWIDCHVRAFEFIEGVPKLVIPR
jgi:hypothetical protein